MIKSLLQRLYINRTSLSYFLSYPLVRPITATLTITKRCNSRCSYCFDWDNPNPPTDPPGEKLEEVLSSVKRLGASLAVFTGGEPLLRPDLPDLIRSAKSRGLQTLLVTNGVLLTKEKAGELAEKGLDNFLLSLDTLNPEHYRQHRGVDFKFAERAIESLEWVKRQYPNRSAGINCVITRTNLDDVIPLVEKMAERGLYVCFDPYHEIVDHNVRGGPLTFGKEEIEKLKRLIDWLIDYRQKRGTVASHPDYLKFIPDYFAGKRHTVRCMTALLNINVSVRLEVKPCWLLPPVGNLYEKSLEEIWYSREMRQARRRIKGRHCPHCWLSCHITDSLNARWAFPAEKQYARILWNKSRG